jgi:hypothetical protein
MSSRDTKDERPKFFRDVHELAQTNDVLAYVLVGVVKRDGHLAIASGAGSRLDDAADITPKIYHMIEQAFEQAMVSIATPEGAPKGGLLN